MYLINGWLRWCTGNVKPFKYLQALAPLCKLLNRLNALPAFVFFINKLLDKKGTRIDSGSRCLLGYSYCGKIARPGSQIRR
jgi:hypothetical protein